MLQKLKQIIKAVKDCFKKIPTRLEVLQLVARAIHLLQQNETLSQTSEMLNNFKSLYLSPSDNRSLDELYEETALIEVYPEDVIKLITILRIRKLKNVHKLTEILRR